MPDSIRLSGFILTQNSEATLAPILRQMCLVCDEVLVVDGGSSDRTLEIAASFPKVRILKRAFDGDFAAQRNYAMDQARGGWLFWLDTDELLGPRALRWLRFLTYVPLVNWYAIPRLWLVEKQGRIQYLAAAPYFRGRQYRLFRNKPGLRFFSTDGGLHEKLRKEAMGWGLALRSLYLYHYDFLLRDRKSREAKVKRYYALAPQLGHIHDTYLWEDFNLPTRDPPEPLPGDLRKPGDVIRGS